MAFAGRAEDHRLLSGKGRYSADRSLPNQVYAAFLRSPYAHANLRDVCVAKAAALDGVLCVLTGTDLAALGYGKAPCVSGIKHADGSAMIVPEWPPLAHGRVRFAGEPVAMVVAVSAAIAADAVEAITCDYEELPVIVATEYDPDPSIAIWPHAPDNVALDFAAGDAAAVERAFQEAKHVVRTQITNQRLVVNPMEPRAVIADYDHTEDVFTFYGGSQGASALADQIATLMNIPSAKIRVVTEDVGGGFGAKTHTYPEYVALLEASKRVRRPVKWVASRSEAFVSDTQGRDTLLDGELAMSENGEFLALRVRSCANTGAYQSSHSVFTATSNLWRCLAGVYRTRLMRLEIKCLYTNTVPVAPYRGAGRPEANLILEHLIDRAACSLSIDPAELRLRNMIATEAMPYVAANGLTYDSGDFPKALKRALELADYDNYSKRRCAARKKGLLSGLGIACYLEIAGGTPFEDLRLDVEATGQVVIRSGLQSNGQGHATVFPRLVSERLGVDIADVSVGAGESRLVPEGAGTVGSRSMTVGGIACLQAADALIEKACAVAAEMLQVPAASVSYSRGRVLYPTSGQSLSLGQIVADGQPLSVLERVRADLTFPNGCHVAEIEIDPITGAVRLVSFIAVDDVGRCIDATLVAGQVHGGIAQGLGQVLVEFAQFDRAGGQLVTGSFMDYAMPRAHHLPAFTIEHLEIPCRTNALGTKGAGEAGTTGALAAGYNAVISALAQAGVESFDMPATPPRIWQALKCAQQGSIMTLS